jgi:hypothetical protein
MIALPSSVRSVIRLRAQWSRAKDNRNAARPLPCRGGLEHDAGAGDTCGTVESKSLREEVQVSEATDDLGVGTAIALRFETQRLPRARELKERVDAGGLLTEADIGFLEQVFQDAQHIMPLLDRNPAWQPLAAQAMELYRQITTKALENEKAER